MIYNNADILFCSGKSEVSKQIKAFTDSIYSHVGLIFNANVNGQRKTFVIEAIQPRVAIIPIEQYFNNYQQSGKAYPGELYLGRFQGGLTLSEVDKIFQSAIGTVGLEYDTASIIRQAFNRIFGAGLQDKDHHRLICSELVGCAYASAGINLQKDKHSFYTPASIGRDNQIIISKLN
jgi:hypothetical protein